MRHNPLGILYSLIPGPWAREDSPASHPYHYANPPPVEELKRWLDEHPLDFSEPGARAAFALSVGAPGPSEQSFERFALFLKAGPPVDFSDELSDEPGLRRSPLCRAMASGALNEAKELLARGANPSGHAGSLGPCPLFTAVSADPCPGLVELLFSYGANPAAITQTGLNALHCAALADNELAIPALLDGGVDPLARAQDGLSPCELALFHKRLAFASALEKEILSRGLLAQESSPSRRLQL